MALPERVAKQGCDICHKNTATKWFGNTSSIVCDDQKCMDEQERRWAQGLADLEAQDRENAKWQY